ncbi:MAG: S-methyl-5'-thioadenosine phosphorylase [Verrucomicrobiales bacterium]|jgi:5'-methylthioadenosine phosphorylase|nr:S-methyl-5'-thioadenosine phosphorylase [Verrucomicrobiales bacterium]MDP4638596.1 S-methyl-5'-thioadenosine phosphorylase [Verrucomicrobiales bacterium]MDP4791223.1 S-methyl-5'-thioadenosine phosphorylase [Verrucomicrobiales bacterium]MDP4938899.1 S-methyl-5'-thioadenosine phosphorylase [Verrucomicrobiales bacterium]MDP5006249.1 S-methyl-5'-thioadenosine phosphorylase [Verrucomicrobiales bacterium]
MSDHGEAAPAIGVIGGSGLYEIEGLTGTEELRLETPFGDPSDLIVRGNLAGRTVCFLPRHGRGHRLLPTELNHRANIWALRSLNVRWIIAVTAVGSLKEEYEPRDIVLPDQFFDRTSQRAHHTFFGEGIVAHIGFSDPISDRLRELLFTTATDLGKRVHDRGTYVNMDGPAFSTRAESETNRKLGFDLIGMTNLPEAKLAREAEIALATLALITDYDCWKIEEDAVSAHSVIEHVHANAATAREILQALIPKMPSTPDWPEHRSLDSAIFTDQSLWPEATSRKLAPLLQRFLKY